MKNNTWNPKLNTRESKVDWAKFVRDETLGNKVSITNQSNPAESFADTIGGKSAPKVARTRAFD